MTTNRDWLFSLPIDEQIVWMNAEHQDGTLDGDTAALNAKIAELQVQVDTLKSRHCPHYHVNEHTCDVHETRIAELTAERDKLKELNEYHALQYELASEDADRLQAQVDELTAERDNWKEHSRTIEYRCKKAETDCEIYRKKFGKCLDYADAIHALMDEGIA